MRVSLGLVKAVKIGITAGFLVDQFGYAGEYGGRMLRTNSFTDDAAPYYEGLGVVMHFSWTEGVALAKGINQIVQQSQQP